MSNKSIVSPFPLQYGLCGPVTLRHILRFLRTYLVILLLGFALTQLSQNTHVQIFGLGLMVPGAGFLAHFDFSTLHGLEHLGATLLGFSLFAGSLVAWFATGNVLLPPSTWILLASTAASMKHGIIRSDILPWAVLLLVVNILSLALIFSFILQRIYTSRRKEANDYLGKSGDIVAATFRGEREAQPEFSKEDVQRMRFLLDRALQPLPEFNGFEWLDQFQTAAVRYQLNFIGYALSMAQATHLPAFHGYLQGAQKNLLLKQTDHRVWRYWQLENLWGNLRGDPDPIARENIMYTGFCATQMFMYHAANGVHDFNKPGSFSLRHPSGKTFAYDFPALLEALKREAQLSPFHLVACEPNWIYPLCNTIAAPAVKAQTPDVWASNEESFRACLENEFIDRAGRFVPCRSRYTGFALPVIGGAMPQALPCFFMNATMPDLALRHWLLLRRDILKDGRLQRRRFWRIDTGNYKFSRASAYTATALAAAELGDQEVRELCLAALEEECPARTDDGHHYRPKASVWSHAVEFFARSAVKDGFRNLSLHANSVDTPHISHACYPDVLVASAHYTEGALKAVFYPGGPAALREVQVSGLLPGRGYVCQGANEENIVADSEGSARIHLYLDGRKAFELKQA